MHNCLWNTGSPAFVGGDTGYGCGAVAPFVYLKPANNFAAAFTRPCEERIGSPSVVCPGEEMRPGNVRLLHYRSIFPGRRHRGARYQGLSFFCGSAAFLPTGRPPVPARRRRPARGHADCQPRPERGLALVVARSAGDDAIHSAAVAKVWLLRFARNEEERGRPLTLICAPGA